MGLFWHKFFGTGQFRQALKQPFACRPEQPKAILCPPRKGIALVVPNSPDTPCKILFCDHNTTLPALLFLTVHYFIVLFVHFLASSLLFPSLSCHSTFHAFLLVPLPFLSLLNSSPPPVSTELYTDRMINVLAVTINFYIIWCPIVIRQLRLKHCRDWRMLWQIILVKVKW